MWLLDKIFRKNKIRVDFRYVDYTTGDKLIKEGWTIAKEEDRNHTIGMVYLELLQDARFTSDNKLKPTLK